MVPRWAKALTRRRRLLHRSGTTQTRKLLVALKVRWVRKAQQVRKESKVLLARQDLKA